jgi:hypothetical protein
VTLTPIWGYSSHAQITLDGQRSMRKLVSLLKQLSVRSAAQQAAAVCCASVVFCSGQGCNQQHYTLVLCWAEATGTESSHCCCQAAQLLGYHCGLRSGLQIRIALLREHRVHVSSWCATVCGREAPGQVLGDLYGICWWSRLTCWQGGAAAL